ncbi:unnamed protein product, partial [Symbiodinium pilosum]
DRRKQRAASKGPRLQKGAKKAVMKAVAALDGKATIRQVKAYMRKHPHIADPSSMERSIHSLRIDKYCERIGQNQDGEDVYAAPTEPNPKGVRRDKRGFHAKMNLSKAEATCLGPLRAKAEDAKKDYDRLRAWRATMPHDEVVAHVRAWNGAHVTKYSNSRIAPRKR